MIRTFNSIAAIALFSGWTTFAEGRPTFTGAAPTQPSRPLTLENGPQETAPYTPLDPFAGERYRGLYRFQGGADGGNPYAGLIADKGGALYGTTVIGGSSGCSPSAYCGNGTVFK